MAKQTQFQFAIENAGARLDVFLADQTKESRSFVQSQIGLGNVLLNGKAPSKVGSRLRPGDTIQATFVTEQTTTVEPVAGKLNILYEDEWLIAINKEPDTVVHPAAGHHKTLVHYLLHHLQSDPNFATLDSERPGVVHRLDKGTSGIILFAKDRHTQLNLSEQFKDRSVQKKYEAIVWGTPPLQGSSNSPIGRHHTDRKRMSSATRKGREAFTRWDTLAQFTLCTHLALYPHTGRTHQLRVHLSEAGYPIVGDETYRKRHLTRKAPPPELDLFFKTLDHTLLHAKELSFVHPKKEQRIHLTAPLHRDFQQGLELLRSFGS